MCFAGFAVLHALPVHAQIIANYNFDGGDSTARRSSKDTNPDSAASILTAGSGLGAEGNATTGWLVSTTAGIGTPSRGNTLFAANDPIVGTGATPGTESDAVSGNDYFEFTLTPNSTTLNLTSFALEFFWARTSAVTPAPPTSPISPTTSAVTVFVRSSLDSFGSTLGSATNTGMWGAAGEPSSGADFIPLSINLDALPEFGNLDSAVTFRIYMRDNYNYTGNSGWGIRLDNIVLEGAVIPEPSAGLLMLGALGSLAVFRRTRKHQG